MGGKSSIEWTDATWNPVTGCDRVSPGCDNCYALALAPRLKAMGQRRYQKDGDPKTSGPGFGVTMHPDKLSEPLRWTKPRRIFVNSMSDLFHAEVEDWFIASVFAVMAATPHHTYQILTKRPQRMRRLASNPAAMFEHLPDSVFMETFDTASVRGHIDVSSGTHLLGARWPLPNVWLGVSVESQEWAWRIDLLAKTPAAVRFLSVEPMIGPVDLEPWLWEEAGPEWAGKNPSRDIGWVIVGGESGPNHRPIDPDWVRSLRDRCVDALCPFFFKQWGGRTPKAGGRLLDGREWNQFPDGH